MQLTHCHFCFPHTHRQEFTHQNRATCRQNDAVQAEADRALCFHYSDCGCRLKSLKLRPFVVWITTGSHVCWRECRPSQEILGLENIRATDDKTHSRSPRLELCWISEIKAAGSGTLYFPVEFSSDLLWEKDTQVVCELRGHLSQLLSRQYGVPPICTCFIISSGSSGGFITLHLLREIRVLNISRIYIVVNWKLHIPNLCLCKKKNSIDFIFLTICFSL